MKKIILIVLILIYFAFFIYSLDFQGKIQIRFPTNELFSLNGAKIYLFASDNQLVSETFTDNDGLFYFKDLLNNETYKIIISRETNSIPRQIEQARFQEKILNKIAIEDDKNIIRNSYELNNANNTYNLKNDLTEDIKQRISNVFKSIQFKNIDRSFVIICNGQIQVSNPIIIDID